MSVTDQITKSIENLSNSRKAILFKGGNVNEIPAFNNLANEIESIPSGDSNYMIVNDTDIKYIKNILPGAAPYAKVKKIGGMSYKKRNLIPPATRKSYTNNGITYTVNDDGSIIANGTATAESNFEILRGGMGEKFSIEKGKNYTVSGAGRNTSTTTYRLIVQDSTYHQTVDSGSTFVANYTNYYAYIRIYSGYVANNLTFYPMLCEGTTSLPYEPYFEGLRNAEVTEIKSEFGNLFNYDNIIDKYKGKGENAGKIWVNSTGYSANFYTGSNGSSTPVPYEYWDKLMYLTKGTYYAYYEIDFYENDVPETDKCIQARSVLLNGQDFWCGYGGQQLFSGGSFTMYEDGYCYLRSYTNKRCYISNLMITREPRDTYIPYKYESIPIPEAVKSLDGYGLGVAAEYYNYIDYERKVFVQNVYRKVFDGTEYISKGTNGAGVTRFIASTPYTAINVSNAVNVVCNHYKPSTIYETNDYAENRLGASASAIRWVDDELLNGTEEEMKAKLKAWYDEGNPLIVDYILAEPIETDISAYLTDEYIEVEGNGTITAVNEFKYDAPTNISYLRRI